MLLLQIRQCVYCSTQVLTITPKQVPRIGFLLKILLRSSKNNLVEEAVKVLKCGFIGSSSSRFQFMGML